MNIYSRIKLCSATFSGIPQYFIYNFVFDDLIDQESYDNAFKQVISNIYPKISANHHIDISLNSPIYFSAKGNQLGNTTEQIISQDYLQIIADQENAPIIALVIQNAEQTLICYLINHVYNDALAAKMLHLAICQRYKKSLDNGQDICRELYCLNDDEFLIQVLESKNVSVVKKTANIIKELIHGTIIASPLVKATRLQFSKDKYGTALNFQRFTFHKTALKKLPKGSAIAQLSALITTAYMEAFNSPECNFTIPIDLRERSMRWLLGNPIGGVFIQSKKSQSIQTKVSMIDKKLESYKQQPTLYWLYQLIRFRMKNMSDETVYKKALKYSSKAHFISTYLGQLDRCNAKKATLAELTTIDSYCYSYPLQTSIAISLTITSFNGDISINLSASEHAFSQEQQTSFYNSLNKLLEGNVQLGRPFK